MIKIPSMLMIGSAGRNAGKTEFACSMISKFRTNCDIIGIKATVIQETDGTCPRGGRGCGVCSSLEGDYCITEETSGPAGKDTTRLINAGASKVFWLRAVQGHLDEAVAALIDKIGRNAVCVCESNRLRLAIEPGLFIMVKNSHSNRYKSSATVVKEYIDLIVQSNGAKFDIDADTINLVNGKWVIAQQATAIILAGGESCRMGCDKSMMPIGGRPMIEHIYNQLADHFSQVLISANDREKYAFLGPEIVEDKVPGCGPLMGIASGLEASRNDLNFVVACDIPEIDIAFVRQMLQMARHCDAVVPKTGPSRYEPLFAVYRKSALPAMREVLSSGQRKIIKIFDHCKVRHVDLSHARWFRNINTIKDYQKRTEQFKTTPGL